MEENPLTTMGGNESLKAFAVILSRCIAKYPDALLEFQKTRPVNGDGWLELYKDFQDKSVLERFSKNIENSARNYDWSRIEDVFVKWGEFGWVIDLRSRRNSSHHSKLWLRMCLLSILSRTNKILSNI